MARLENTVSVDSFFCPYTEVFAFFSTGEISALRRGVNKIFGISGLLETPVWSHNMFSFSLVGNFVKQLHIYLSC